MRTNCPQLPPNLEGYRSTDFPNPLSILGQPNIKPMESSDLSFYQRLLVAIDTFVLFLGISSTILRFYARRVSKTKLWLDDYFMAAGVVSILVFNCIRNPRRSPY
jgi:hypothetical protein